MSADEPLPALAPLRVTVITLGPTSSLPAVVAPDYLYEDFAGPAPLDLAGTRALLDRWL